MFLAYFLKKPALTALTATALMAGVPALAHAEGYDYDKASHYRTSEYDRGSSYRREPTSTSHYWDHVARAYGARDGYGYYRSCGCYRNSYYSGNRYRNYGPELYDYSAQVFDNRAHYDRRTSYEYRWPRRNY